MSEPLRVAYLTSAFARPSDTFIRHEVNQLRAAGLFVQTFSVRRPPIRDADGAVDPDVVQHQLQTKYLLEAGTIGLLASAAQMFIRRPLATLKAAALAWRTRPPGLRGALKQAMYFIESLRLARHLFDLRSEILHNHIGENSATVAMLAADVAGIPFSLTIHGPGIFFAPHDWALGAKLDRAAFTACISDFCRSQCMAFASPATWNRLHVVRCGVPAPFVSPDGSPRKTDGADHVNGAPLFVCVGRLCAEKAQRIVIEAAQIVAASGRPLRVVLVGDGPDRADLERQIAVAGLGDVVSLVGWQSSQRIIELLSEARALVLASFAEGLPVVIMESLALQRPVIAPAIAAIPELVETGATGWLIPPGDAHAAAAAMQQAIEASPDELRQLGCNGRQRVLERHDPVRQAGRLSELLFQAANRTQS